MKTWNKKDVSKEMIRELMDKYNIDSLTASILLRRNIKSGEDIQYFLENDKRFLHNPFLFSNMEDAVDRILQAQEEGEIVLIFGDRDVDGISSTTILYEYLKSINIDVRWKLPTGNDGYGLSTDAIDDFYKNNGTLIITVDCGISNNEEIKYAANLGIDVIVLDHHNPPEQLPTPAIIINPKCLDSGYPFPDISGAAVVYKVVTALRFSKTPLYKQELCLLTVKKVNEANTIECLKIQNLVKKDYLSETIIPNSTPFSKTRLLKFLQGQQIFVWDEALTTKLMKETFGNSIEFNFLDLRPEISKLIPQIQNISLLKLKTISKIAKYNLQEASEIQGFYNIFVTFINKQQQKQFPQDVKNEEKDLQLVALAALADIMPLVNENRILVYQGIDAMNKGKCRTGLTELLSKVGLLGERLTSSKLSWNIIPVLNATGRLGKPELGVNLFITEDSKERENIASKIIELNQERKELGARAWEIGSKKAEESINKYKGKLCVIVDEEINRGVSGILAGRLVQNYSVPSMAITFVDDIAIGSMRSCRGFSITPFLDQMSDIFLNHGGHNFAAGFSFSKEKLNEFYKRLELLAPTIELEADSEEIKIDAELPAPYLTPNILKIIDKFEPYGESNPELTFISKNLKIQDATIMGKTEKKHLKLILDCGTTKWPAIFWSEGERLNKDFCKCDSIDILYQIQRNTFNMTETPQIVLTETYRSL